MLAVFGFLVTAVLFVIFALTIDLPATKSKRYQNFKYAYLLLAAAFVCFGLASLINTSQALALAVIVGNFILLGATLFILDILFEGHKYRKQIVYGSALAGLLLILVRIFYFYPKPYMEDSILVFNSQRFVSFMLAAVFLLIWLPVNLRVASLITQKYHNLTQLFAILYALATLSAVIFLLAKAPLALALSFTAISVSFLALILSNLYIKQLEVAKHGK